MLGATRWTVLVPCVLALPGAIGCTGLTWGENTPGGDTYLDDGTPPPDDEPYVGDGQNWCVFNGSIAVDPRTDTAYTALSTAEVECEEWWDGIRTEKSIYAVPYGGTPAPILDVTGKDDVRILFPQDQILVMSEENDRDTLTFLDPSSYEKLDELDQSVRYHGTRMSSSRRFVAVADNTSETPDIHVIDTETRDIAVIPNNGDWLEAMWTHTTDRLLAIIFYDSWGPEVGHARILGWSRDEATGGFFRATDERGLWQDPDLDVPIEGVEGDLLFSYTWVGISPDDRYAVFPVMGDLGETNGDHILVVVDLQDGSHRLVHDARGPVGFTPDGSTIVSYRYVDVPGGEDGVTESIPALVLLEADTLEETTVPLEDLDFGPQFFVTHHDNVVVITSPFGSSSILLHDVDNGITTEIDTPDDQALYEFVSRDEASELWLVTDGLYRLDYADAEYERIDLPFTPSHINRLAREDLLVLDDPSTVRLVYLEPDSRAVEWSVNLPTPQ